MDEDGASGGSEPRHDFSAFLCPLVRRLDPTEAPLFAAGNALAAMARAPRRRRRQLEGEAGAGLRRGARAGGWDGGVGRWDTCDGWDGGEAPHEVVVATTLACGAPACAARFSLLSDWEAHDARHHRWPCDDDGGGGCGGCGRVLPTALTLELHRTEAHDAYFRAVAQLNEAPVYRCVVEGCGARHWSPAARRRHAADDHGDAAAALCTGLSRRRRRRRRVYYDETSRAAHAAAATPVPATSNAATAHVDASTGGPAASCGVGGAGVATGQSAARAAAMGGGRAFESAPLAPPPRLGVPRFGVRTHAALWGAHGAWLGAGDGCCDDGAGDAPHAFHAACGMPAAAAGDPLAGGACGGDNCGDGCASASQGEMEWQGSW